MNLLFHQEANSHPFYSVLNEYYNFETATVKLEFLIYFHYFFLGVTPLNTHQKTIALPRYSHGTVFH